jgi:hypothetical protein
MSKFNYIFDIVNRTTGPVCKFSICSESLCDYNECGEEVIKNDVFMNALFLGIRLHDLTIKKETEYVKGFNVYFHFFKGY